MKSGQLKMQIQKPLKKGKEEQVPKKEVLKGKEIQKHVQEIQDPFQKRKEVDKLLKKTKKGLMLSQKLIPQYQALRQKKAS